MRISILAVVIALVSGGYASAQYHPYAVPASLKAPSYVPYYSARRQDAPPQPAELHEPNHVMPVPQEHYDAPEIHEHHAPSTMGSTGHVIDGEGYMDCGGGYCNMGCNYLGEAGYVPGNPNGNFYAAVSGLVMTRADCDNVWLSFDATPGGGEPSLLGSNDADIGWNGGAQVDVGFRMCEKTWLSATYWFISELDGEAGVTDGTGQINSTLDFRSLDFSPTVTVNDLYNGARAQKVWRSSEFHNIELNVLNGPCWCPCDCVRMSWMGGARFFRFSDSMLFGTSHDYTEFGIAPAYDAYYDIDVKNNLIGGQIGFRLDWRTGCKCSFFAAPKIGIYNNYVTQRQHVYDGTGTTAYRFADGRAADLSSSENVFAVLSEVDLGVNYQLTCNISVYGGYRLVAATGVATASEQIPYLGDDLDSMSDINTNGNLVLHGAFAGLLIKF